MTDINRIIKLIKELDREDSGNVMLLVSREFLIQLRGHFALEYKIPISEVDISTFMGIMVVECLISTDCMLVKYLGG